MTTTQESRYNVTFGFAPKDSGWGASFNKIAGMLGGLLNSVLMSDTVNTPPQSPADADCYYVAPGGAAAWLHQDGNIAIWQGGAWNFYPAPYGLRSYINDRKGFYYLTKNGFAPEPGGTGGGGGDGGGTTPPPTTVTAHRIWRITASKSSNGGNSYNQFAEITMSATKGGANLIGTGTASSSSIYNNDSSYGPDKAVDGLANTSFCSAPGLPQWWQYDFGASNPVVVLEFVITAAQGNDHNYAPSNFVLSVSDDGATWTDQTSYSSGVTYTDGGSNTFEVTVPPAPPPGPLVVPFIQAPNDTGAAKGTALKLYGGDGNKTVQNGTSAGGDIVVKAGRGYASDQSNEMSGTAYVFGGDINDFNGDDYAKQGHNSKSMPGALILEPVGRALTPSGGRAILSGGDNEANNYGGGDVIVRGGRGSNGAGNAYVTSGVSTGSSNAKTVITTSGIEPDPYHATGDLMLTTGSTYNGQPGNIHIAAGKRSDNGVTGLVYLDKLPVADPKSANALWNNNGVLSISAG